MKTMNLNHEIRTAVLSAVAIFSLLAIWVALAPLEGAAVAPGQVKAASSSKSVQHANGGKIKEIYVKNGQHVAPGEHILKLDTQAQEESLLLNMKKLVVLKAERAVARASLANESDVSFSDELLSASSRLDVLHLLHDARMLFIERNQQLATRAALSKTRMEQLATTLRTANQNLKSLYSQKQILDQQLAAMEKLASGKHITQLQLQSTQQEHLRLAMMIDQQQGTIDEAKTKHAALKLEADLDESENRRYWRERLKMISAQIPDIEQDTSMLKLSIERSVVQAEHAGIVTHLAYSSPGAVLRPGEEILKLVPDADDLVVEAKLKTSDVTGVEIGQIARVKRLSDRSAPTLDGIVKRVSADTHQDDSGTYYRIEIALTSSARLAVGEPVESILLRERRTVLDYLLSPILDGAERSLRES